MARKSLTDGAKVIAVAGPKGGVGKSTLAFLLAVLASRVLQLRVLLVDLDVNRSALDLAEAAGPELAPFLSAPGLDDAGHDALAAAHGHAGLDLIVADLPGAEESGALRALLTRHGSPVVDALVFPTPPDIMDLRPLLRQIAEVIDPMGLPYLVALCRVHRDRLRFAADRQAELRAQGIAVAATVTRNLLAHPDAVEEHTTVLDMPGSKRSGVRAAEREYRALVAEVVELVGIDATAIRIREDE